MKTSIKKSTDWFRNEMAKVLRENSYKSPLGIDELFRGLMNEILELHSEIVPDAISNDKIIGNYPLVYSTNLFGVWYNG